MGWTLSKIIDKIALDHVAFWKDRDNGEGALNIEGIVQLANEDGETVNPTSGEGSVGASSGNTWSTKQKDFTAIITNGTKNITIGGLPWTFDWENVSQIQKKTSAGVVTVCDIDTIAVSGSVITLADEDDFVTGDLVSVSLIGPDKGYDEAIDSNIVTVLNQDYAHWTSPEHLIDVSAVGDAVTSRYVIPMESYKNLSLHIKLANSDAGDTITLTMWATNNADADDSADTDWVDVSSTILGAATKAINNGTLEEIYFVDTNIIPLKYMIKTITVSGGSDTNAADVYIKKA